VFKDASTFLINLISVQTRLYLPAFQG